MSSSSKTRTISLGFLGIAIFILIASCSQTCSNQPGEPGTAFARVVSFFPEQKTWEAFQPMEITFDTPVIPEDKVGSRLEKRSVDIEPSLPYIAHWHDRQTLVITPSEAMSPATRYTVRLEENLDVDIPEDQRTHTFIHQPLEALRLLDVDRDWFPPDAEFKVQFNLPVQAADIAEKCSFSGAENVGVKILHKSDVSPTVSVRPSKELSQGKRYRFTCEDIQAVDGNVPLDKAFVREVRVYPEVGIKRFEPDGNSVTPDELTLKIVTKTPLKLEDFRRYVSIDPRVPGFYNRWVSRGDTTFEQVVNLEASTDYKIQIRPGFSDQFGQKQKKRQSFSFRTADSAPRLYMEAGIYAIESQSDGYPVWSRNVEEFDIECAYIPAAKIPLLLTTHMDYDPWYSDRTQTIEWEKLGVTPSKSTISVKKVINRWELHNIDFEKTCKGRGEGGLYLTELRSEKVAKANAGQYWFRYPFRVLGNVTNLGVLLKAGPSSGLVWVAQLSDGAVVPGANVTVYSPRGRKVFQGRTDSNGILKLPGSSELLKQRGTGDRYDYGESEEDWDYIDSYRQQRMIVVVQKGTDIAAVDGNWSNGIQLWNFGVRRDTQTGGKTTIRGFVLSDRGIYRPGETVHFKGFVRELKAGGSPKVPAKRDVFVTIEDGRGTELYRNKVELTQFGGFSFDYRLSKQCSLGDYHVRAKLGHQTFRERFSVEEFRPVPFEITMPGSKAKRPTIGSKVNLRFNASYLFGAPVASADVEWSVRRRKRVIRFRDYPSYVFQDFSDVDSSYFWSRYENDTYSSYISGGEALTSEEGDISISFRDTSKSLRGPQDYIVNVTVIDPTDQAVSKSKVVTMHPTEFYLGLHTQEFVQAVRMPFSVNAVAVDPQGKRISTKAKLSFILRNRRCERSSDPYSYPICNRETRIIWTRDVQLESGGTTTERIEPEEPGEYLIKLEGEDSSGNSISTSSFVWVIGEGEAFWSGDESARMSLIASKESYDPGETAKLVPQAQIGGATALLTTERDGIIDARVLNLDSGVPSIEVPILGSYAPNIFVSVAAVRGRTGEGDAKRPIFRMGVTNLDVSTDQKHLDIEINTERSDYRPGETVKGQIRVLSQGQPVKAEVALSVADEGVLQLVNYQTPNPIKEFYRPWGLGVESGTNWNRIVRRRGPSGWDEGEDGDDLGASGADIRSRFVSSAFWAPSLLTDGDGRADFTFEAPDNLTAFRVMAVAADAGDRFGSSEKRIRIRKDFVVNPILPRFFEQGDELSVGAIVHNYTEKAREVKLVFSTKGLSKKMVTHSVKVAKNGTKRFGFITKVTGKKKVLFTVSGQMDTHRDGVKKRLPVRPSTVGDTKMLTSAHLDQAGEVIADLNWPKNTILDESYLDMTFDRAGLAELKPSLQYLIEYPYGCLEQTISQVIPLLDVRDLARSMKIAPIQNQNRLDVFIRLGLGSIIRHQHTNGQFSFWPSSNSDPYLSAYAMFALHRAKNSKFWVRRDPIKRGIKSLKRFTRNRSRTSVSGRDNGILAMSAFVLASFGTADTGLNARLYEARNSQPTYGKAFLLRALHRSKAPSDQIKTLLSEIHAEIRVDGELAMIRETRDVDRWYSSDVRSTAITLAALLEVNPDSDLIPKLVEGLKVSRKNTGHWYNTQENVFSLMGLADYARSKVKGNTNVEIFLDEKSVTKRKLRGARIIHERIKLKGHDPGKLRIVSDGPLYYSTILSLKRPRSTSDSISKGFEISREYLDFNSGEKISKTSVGELIKVRVRVSTSSTQKHIAVTDPIPSGCEIVKTNPNINRRSYGSRYRRNRSPRWAHKEFRDDRALAFMSVLSEEATFEYILRPILPGTFTIPPAQVEAMYDPGSYARTAGSSLTIEP